MSPALYYTIARYVVAWGCGLLVQRGWSIANLDGATMDAVAQIVVGVIGAVAMGVIGVLTSTVRWTMARLKAHHRSDLIDGAATVPGVVRIEATQEIALATQSKKVVAQAVAGGV